MIALRMQRVEELYVKILEDIYKECTIIIKLHKVSNKIPIQKGLRQDDIISPQLYTVVLEEGFKNLEWEKSGIWINGKYQNNLLIC